MNAPTPLMRQYLAIKERFPDCILFFRMGDFYEMFYEDARIASSALNIALTSRDKGEEDATPMCGVPYHALETYLARMVRSGRKVAICEQMEDPAESKGIVRREVVRIVTPGTLVEDYLLEEKRASLLVALAFDPSCVGFACADLSTGAFLVREFPGPNRANALLDEISRIKPKEILVNAGPPDLPDGLAEFRIERAEFPAFDAEDARRRLTDHFGVASLEGFGIAERPLAATAAGAVLWYVKKNSPNALGTLDSMRWVPPGDGMELDAATLRNLEIVENLSGGAEGTLVEVLDKTCTPMGARLLRDRLVKPLVDPAVIRERLDKVTSFFSEPARSGAFRAFLREVGDFERGISRIAGKNFTPRDFSSLLRSLKSLPDLKEAAAHLPGEALRPVLAEWDSLEDLSGLLGRAVDPGHPATFKEPGFIRTGYNEELDQLRSFREGSAEALRRLEEREREGAGIPSLKVGYNRIYGYYIEVTNKHAEKVPGHYLRKQSLVNCVRFSSPELKEIEETLLASEERARTMEDTLIEQLRMATLSHLKRVRSAAHLVARLDVAAGLAEAARLHDYCVPEVTDGRDLLLEECRHPVIERLMTGESFVPNDVAMTGEAPRLMVITGPNMAGKSTYLRQVALAVLMAQAGSYVPAKRASIGLADRIFTRVGAQDRLQKGLSTFMVEMVETANILNNATGKSLVVLDEIGRGTSTFDGISIAWATAEFLARLKARTLFATHYHELADLALTEPGVGNFNATVKEYRQHLVFLRKMEPGPADKSYGIQVARLAGLPKEVLRRAGAVLRQLEKMEFGADGKPSLKGEDMKEDPQVSLFDVRRHPVVEALKNAEVNSMTPLEALNFLQQLKDSLD